MGKNLAILNLSGTIPVANELLKTISNGFDITIFISLSVFVGILKGPVAFDTFNFDISSGKLFERDMSINNF